MLNNTDPWLDAMGDDDEAILVGMDIIADEEEEDGDNEIEDTLRCIITDQEQDKKQQVSSYHELDGELDDLSYKAEANIEYPEDSDEIADALRCIIDQEQDKKQHYHKLDGELDGLSHKAEATIEYPEDGDKIEEPKQETFASSSSSAAVAAAAALGRNNSDNSTNTNTKTTTTTTATISLGVKSLRYKGRSKAISPHTSYMNVQKRKYRIVACSISYKS